MRSTSLYVVLLTVTVLLSIGFNLTRWRLPNDLRPGLLWSRKAPRPPRGGIKTELALIAAACLVMPVAAICLTVGLIVVAARL